MVKMVKIITKEKQDVIFEQHITSLIFFLGRRKPFVMRTDINTIEFMLGGVLEIQRKPFVFDCIYLNALDGPDVLLIAENIRPLSSEDETEIKNKQDLHYLENKVQYFEQALVNNDTKEDINALIIELRKRLSIYYYRQWRKRIWE